MSQAELKEKLRAIIADVSEVDVIPDETPFKDLGIDSMMAIEIVTEVERTFKVQIPEEDLQKMTHFTAVYDLVNAHIPQS